jgi:hypothetical protein
MRYPSKTSVSDSRLEDPGLDLLGARLSARAAHALAAGVPILPGGEEQEQ